MYPHLIHFIYIYLQNIVSYANKLNFSIVKKVSFKPKKIQANKKEIKQNLFYFNSNDIFPTPFSTSMVTIEPLIIVKHGPLWEMSAS